MTQEDTSIIATGIGLTDFSYFVSDDDPVCQPSNTMASFTNGAIASDLTDGQWACFKAKNQQEVYIYNKLQVDLSEPVITIVIDKNSIKAESDDVSDLYYSVTDDQPDCDLIDAEEYIKGKKVFDLTDGQWVCFKGTNDKGVDGYIKHQFGSKTTSGFFELLSDWLNWATVSVLAFLGLIPFIFILIKSRRRRDEEDRKDDKRNRKKKNNKKKKIPTKNRKSKTTKKKKNRK